MILLYVTCKDKTEAKKIVRMLLKKRLIACANLFPINSMYEWKGKIVDGREVVLVGKTTNGKADAAEKAIMRIHSYECPCIMRIPVKANKEFEGWIERIMRDDT